MKKIFLATYLILCVGFVNVFGQKKVSGNVTAVNTNEIVANASVLVKGSTNGTTTDAKGNFDLDNVSTNDVIVVSAVGYQSLSIPVGKNVFFDIKLLSESQALNEVVVTGYGIRKKSTYTGAATIVGSDKLQDKPFASVDQALQGNVPGLQLSATSGIPGSFQNIRIRGVSSITAGNEPLFVIDGVPVVNGTNQQETVYGNLGILSSLNSDDIESISVLKDATATALYGARGANGVIVVTTKQGKRGKPVISLSGNYGSVRKASPGPKMLNASQYAELYYESRVNAGQAATIDEAKTKFPLAWDGVTSTDWQDVATNHDAKTQSADLSIRGGNEKSRYFASIGLMDQDGANVGVYFKRTTGKLNYETEITDKLKLTSSILGSYINQSGQYEGASWFGSPDAEGLYLKPFDPVYNDDGSYNLKLHSSYYHPLYQADNTVHSRKQTRMLGSVGIAYEIIKNLKFTSNIGLDYLNTNELNYDDRHYGDGQYVNGYSFQYNTQNFNYDWKNMLDYNLNINSSNNLALKLVYEAQKDNYSDLSTGGNDIAADGLIYPSSVSTITYWSGFTGDWAINSIVGMANYSFKNKFFLDGTIRREGNSRFAPGNRWGTFYSIGASYDLMKENFMANTKWLNSLKIRTSYGKTGNSNIGLNAYQAFLGYSASYNSIAGIVPSQYGNNALTWENNNTYNIGVDFNLLGRINGTVDYFQRKTYDLLLDVPLTPTSGFSSQTQNAGKMENKGIEASLGVDIIQTKSIKWNISANFTSVHNKVTELPHNSEGDEIGITNTWKTVTEGEPVYSWYLTTWAGVNPENGAPLWYKAGKSGETTSNFNEAARSIQGSPSPTYYGSINTNLEFKGVYVNASVYYSGGNHILDRFAYHLRSDGRFNYTLSNGYADLLNRWQKPGDIAENPKNVYLNSSNSFQFSTRNLYKGDFMRLRDVTIGYKLPAGVLKTLHVSAANIYLRGNNIWTQAAKGLPFDPETDASGLLSLIAQPIKTYVAGINFSF